MSSKKSTKSTKSKFSNNNEIKILDLIDENNIINNEEFENNEEFQIIQEKKMDEYSNKIEFCFKSLNNIKEHLNFYTLPIGNNLSVKHLEILLDKIY